MTRPTKFRKVQVFPVECYFAPYGKHEEKNEDIELKVEELEAMRLKDMEELSQEECAECMEISRQTFQNIIDSARKKVATALLQGRGIRIKGGNYLPKNCLYRCCFCGEIYEPSQEADRYKCPNCGNNQMECGNKDNKCIQWCNFR